MLFYDTTRERIEQISWQQTRSHMLEKGKILGHSSILSPRLSCHAKGYNVFHVTITTTNESSI